MDFKSKQLAAEKPGVYVASPSHPGAQDFVRVRLSMRVARRARPRMARCARDQADRDRRNARCDGRPGPKGPNPELIGAVVAMKRRNPSRGCPHIAQQIALAFGVEIDKDVVRRILSCHYRPESDSAGPSWLTFLGHRKDSLWSCDLFRCESATLRTHWVYTRKTAGEADFGAGVQ